MSERDLGGTETSQGFNVYVRVRPMSRKELASAVARPTFRSIIRTRNNSEVSPTNP